AGRYLDSGLLNQKRGEFDGAKSAERFGDWRPSEHRGRRRGYRPARSAEGLDQCIAAAPVCGAHFVDAVVRTVERRGRRYLNRRESAVIEIGLHPSQRGDDALIADGKTDTPAW